MCPFIHMTDLALECVRENHELGLEDDGHRMRRLESNESEKESTIPMPHTMRLAPCSGSANIIETLAASEVAPWP